MTNCRLLHENLYAYAENGLDPLLMEQLYKHIAGCQECASLVNKFNNVLNEIAVQATVEPRPYAETRIMQRIESEWEKREKPYYLRLRVILQPAAISLGVLVALAIGLLIGTEGANRRSNYNNEMIQAVRTDLSIPEFMNDNPISFTE
jgi:hypothetical protein